MTFEDAVARADRLSESKQLLLGNGFSIGAHPDFAYKRLYDEACKEGLSDRVKGVFDHFGTANFEDILKRLDEGVWLADQYGLQPSLDGPTMQDDHQGVKSALTSVITRIHPPSRNHVDGKALLACAQFLERFDSVFTTNYDILAYWAFLAKDPPALRDCFFEEGGDGYRIFEIPNSGGKTIHYLHGALHIYTRDGEVRKRTVDGGIVLIDKVREGLDSKEYPLIVTEGDSTQKMARIEASGYLSWCLQEFQLVDKTLFIYGSSLGDPDEHLWRAIVENRHLERIVVGVNGNGTSAKNKEVIARATRLGERRKTWAAKIPVSVSDLKVRFFNSTTAPVWAVPGTSDP